MKNYYITSGKGKENNVSLVLKTLKPEERSIVGVLDEHGGTYLQKYITKEAGLSRLKTHRIVAALSERGIVIVEKYGNTNQVSLVKWFHDGMHNQQPTWVFTKLSCNFFKFVSRAARLSWKVHVIVCQEWLHFASQR